MDTVRLIEIILQAEKDEFLGNTVTLCEKNLRRRRRRRRRRRHRRRRPSTVRLKKLSVPVWRL